MPKRLSTGVAFEQVIYICEKQRLRDVHPLVPTPVRLLRSYGNLTIAAASSTLNALWLA
jgi:hypothetical protein